MVPIDIELAAVQIQAPAYMEFPEGVIAPYMEREPNSAICKLKACISFCTPAEE